MRVGLLVDNYCNGMICTNDVRGVRGERQGRAYAGDGEGMGECSEKEAVGLIIK